MACHVYPGRGDGRFLMVPFPDTVATTRLPLFGAAWMAVPLEMLQMWLMPYPVAIASQADIIKGARIFDIV